ncbi:unnamed protein product [Angiostrongylus costaricensis]|uniref:RING-type E3 ubiquitin transferase n=1 Tax=Angiostrongylus costaricensis TaxID=334426 RepID=A0A0R3Q1G4_ANGCS|nr:unnamed protein product [Angiostrongylus costaricensis]
MYLAIPISVKKHLSFTQMYEGESHLSPISSATSVVVEASLLLDTHTTKMNIGEMLLMSHLEPTMRFLKNIVERNARDLSEAVTSPFTWLGCMWQHIPTLDRFSVFDAKVLIIAIRLLKELYENGGFRAWLGALDRWSYDNQLLEVDDDYDEEIDISDYGLDSSVYDDAASFASDGHDDFSYSSDDETACAAIFDSNDSFNALNATEMRDSSLQNDPTQQDVYTIFYCGFEDLSDEYLLAS